MTWKTYQKLKLGIHSFVFIFFLSIESSIVHACEVKLPHGLLIIERGGSYVVDEKNCDHETLNLLNTFLSSAEGSLTSHQISQILHHEKKIKNISISPSLIKVIQFKNLLREEMNHHRKENHIQLSHPRLVPSLEKKFLTFDHSTKLSLDSKNVLKTNTIQLRMEDSLNEKHKEHLIKVNIEKLQVAYFLKQNVKAFSPISPDMIEEKLMTNIPYTQVFQDLSQLHFFQTNKPLLQGSLLKGTDLSGLTLVRSGSKTEIIIENDLVKIKTFGLARGHGGIGDFIEVMNVNNKKKYMAKIIDFNKVFIKL